MLRSACNALRSSPWLGEGSSTAVFNTLPWERTEVIALTGEGAQAKLGRPTWSLENDLFVFMI